MATPPSEHRLECKSMILRLHSLFDIPRDLVSLDSRREDVELVLKPTAKYYSENKRFSKLELPEQYVAFSPSAILFKGDRFVFDFAAAFGAHAASASRASSPPRPSTTHASSTPAVELKVASTSTGTTSTGTGGEAGTSAASRLPGGRLSDAAGPSAIPRSGFTESPTTPAATTNANGSEVPFMESDGAKGNGAAAGGRQRMSGSGSDGACPLNEIHLRYPTRSDLKVILEVLVGVRQRRHDSSAVRWITPSWVERGLPGAISTFAASDGEVQRHKLVNRFVGLTVGHLSCSMELPYVSEDLRSVCIFAPSAMADAADRLSADYERLVRIHARAKEEQLQRIHADRDTRRNALLDRLQAGESELDIYTRLLLDLCPDFFTRRIQRICSLYPPTAQCSPWVHTDAATLAHQYAGREMELLRALCAELGPDLSAISPRNRFLSYTTVQPLGDELWRWIRENFVNQENDILDYEPDAFMESLALQYNTLEPSPIQYGFPPITYELDRRSYFGDCLRFPVNREHHRHRDEALAARQTRVPLQLTPCERPLHPIRPTSRNVGEIDILLEKYKPEFVQLVPSVADAMECVTQQNERLLQRLLKESQHSASATTGTATTTTSSSRERMRSLPYEVNPSGFQLFQSERATGSYVALLNRFAEYTYISPSTLLSAVIYLDRLCLRHTRLLLTSRNIEKLLVAAVRVASKVVDLRSVNNKNFATVFSLVIQDMNDLESEFLRLMGFDFFLSPMEFNHYAHLIQLPAAYMQMPTTLRPSPVPATVTAITAAADVTGEGVAPLKGSSPACRPTLSRTQPDTGSGAAYGGGAPSSEVVIPSPTRSNAATGAEEKANAGASQSSSPVGISSTTRGSSKGRPPSAQSIAASSSEAAVNSNSGAHSTHAGHTNGGAPAVSPNGVPSSSGAGTRPYSTASAAAAAQSEFASGGRVVSTS